jgi:prephenate dehydrogenase
MIGGSIAKAARLRNLCEEIVALDREQNAVNLQLAMEHGVIDRFYTDASAALTNADIVIIAAPVGAMHGIFQQIAPFWRADCLYSDTGSTKASVIQAAEQAFGGAPPNFVPAHPIAGAERSGVAAANAELFTNRRLIITPLPNTDANKLAELTRFWERLGSSVSEMNVEHHDTVLAATSHLPHILAFALVGLLGRKDEQREIFKYAASGFKDFSRIASSDPTMWLDICLANKHELLPLIRQYQAELETIAQMLAEDQTEQLFETFTYAGHARQRYLDQLDD